MRSLFTPLFLLIFICSMSTLNAQSKTNKAPQTTSEFLLTVQNITQTAPNKLEFDVYLQNTLPAGSPFQLAQIQLGFLMNASIQGAGTLSLTLTNAGSGLNGFQQFNAAGTLVSSLIAYPDNTLLQQSNQNVPGSGFGTFISAVAPGTKLVHYILTNSVSFASNTVMDLAFISNNYDDPNQELFLTGVSYYPNDFVANLIVTPGTNAKVIGNPILNPTATTFDVTGTGSTCIGTGGLPVGLVGSELGAIYTLYKNSLAQTPTVLGTGASISFGNQLAGTYTIQCATGSTAMIGNAVITENQPAAAGVSITVDQNPLISKVSATFTATPTGGGATPSYQWYNGATPVGTNSAVYSCIPSNGNVITVSMTSNAQCVTGSPATSNAVTMSVVLTSVDQIKMSIEIYSKDKNIMLNCSQVAKQVFIYNSLGTLVKTGNNVKGLNSFNLNDYSTGCYFVKIVTDNEVFTQKVLLK